MHCRYQSLLQLSTIFCNISRKWTAHSMKLLVVVASLLSVALAAPRFKLGEEWQLWKTQHDKSYLSQLEELERHVIWQSNKKYIEAHNQNAHILGFTLKMNHFGDMVSTLEIATHAA